MAGSEASAHQMTNACTARVYRLLTTKKEFNIRMHICHKMSRLARVEARVLVIIGRRGLKVRVISKGQRLGLGLAGMVTRSVGLTSIVNRMHLFVF